MLASGWLASYEKRCPKEVWRVSGDRWQGRESRWLGRWHGAATCVRERAGGAHTDATRRARNSDHSRSVHAVPLSRPQYKTTYDRCNMHYHIVCGRGTQWSMWSASVPWVGRMGMRTTVKICCKYGRELFPILMKCTCCPSSTQVLVRKERICKWFRTETIFLLGERKQHRVTVLNGDHCFYITLYYGYRFCGDAYVNLEKRGSEKCDSLSWPCIDIAFMLGIKIKLSLAELNRRNA